MDQQGEQQAFDTPLDDWEEMVKAEVTKMDVDTENSTATVNPALLLANPLASINHPPPRASATVEGSSPAPPRLQPPRTGYVWDQAMRLHAPMIESEEDHPEAPERIDAIKDILQRNGLLAKMQKLAIRECTVDEVCLVHSLDHWNSINGIASKLPLFLIHSNCSNR